jgi:hypothetical protein
MFCRSFRCWWQPNRWRDTGLLYASPQNLEKADRHHDIFIDGIPRIVNRKTACHFSTAGNERTPPSLWRNEKLPRRTAKRSLSLVLWKNRCNCDRPSQYFQDTSVSQWTKEIVAPNCNYPYLTVVFACFPLSSRLAIGKVAYKVIKIVLCCTWYCDWSSCGKFVLSPEREPTSDRSMLIIARDVDLGHF